MITLQNSQLELQLLDPDTDKSFFGVRYCTGGYIFQIIDTSAGPLLSGPTYPHDFNWFDGQGIPDAFNLSPLALPDGTHSQGDQLIPGIGICDSDSRRIISPCSWEKKLTATAAIFSTHQAAGDWSFTLEKRVYLLNRTVRTEVSISNTGEPFIPVRWFPHPFFPQLPQGQDELIRLNTDITFPYDSVYAVAENGFIARKNWPWTTGYSQPLDHNCTAPLVITQRHPVLGQVTAFCSYSPDFFLIWGNEYTFSWEPYLERTVASGQTVSWWIDYQF